MLDELDHVFDDHPSLEASLEDFENNSRRSPLFGMPSQHSGFRSEESDGEEEDPPPPEPRWSPPGLRQHDYVPDSGWYRHQPYPRDKKAINERLHLKPTVGLNLSPSQSREPSPQYEDALEGPREDRGSDDTVAANVPLPIGADTPQTGRSPSPGLPPNLGATNHRSEDDGSGFRAENLSNCRHCLPRR